MADPWVLVATDALQEGAVFQLAPEEARHVAGPLRRRPGDSLTLADGRGVVAQGVIRDLAKGRVEVEVGEVSRHLRPACGEVELALGVLHGQAMDWAVQKAVEVGVERLVPLLCERAQLCRSAAAGRLGHWQRLAVQAIKQCRRPWAMEVAEPCDLVGLLERTPPERGLVADPEGMAMEDLAPGQAFSLLVGPEGGLSPGEDDVLDSAGWRRVRLGPHVLRAETAAVVGSARLVALQEESRRRDEG